VSAVSLRVRSVRRSTPSTQIVRLELGSQPFAYRAGQVAMIGPAGGDRRVPYSIASAPEETERDGTLEFLIKVDGDGRWGEDFEPVYRGSLLAVDGPIGAFGFPDLPAERRFLFIAGGTGIAPLRAMIVHALSAGLAPVNPAGARPLMRLLYSARTPHGFSYLSELRAMARRGEIELALTATREVPARWRGGRGRITAAHVAPLLDDPETLCFVCGPASMVDDVPRILRQLGIRAERIRVEEW
jgi:NAD(P)H-flavin reductase